MKSFKCIFLNWLFHQSWIAWRQQRWAREEEFEHHAFDRGFSTWKLHDHTKLLTASTSRENFCKSNRWKLLPLFLIYSPLSGEALLNFHLKTFGRSSFLENFYRFHSVCELEKVTSFARLSPKILLENSLKIVWLEIKFASSRNAFYCKMFKTKSRERELELAQESTRKLSFFI